MRGWINRAMKLKKEEIAAMAIAVIAEEVNEELSNLRIVSFKKIQNSGLQQYLEENQIDFKKYQLGDR